MESGSLNLPEPPGPHRPVMGMMCLLHWYLPCFQITCLVHTFVKVTVCLYEMPHCLVNRCQYTVWTWSWHYHSYMRMFVVSVYTAPQSVHTAPQSVHGTTMCTWHYNLYMAPQSVHGTTICAHGTTMCVHGTTLCVHGTTSMMTVIKLEI
jgi:hypothetical protein